MKTVTEHIRQHILLKSGAVKRSLQEIANQNWSGKFIQLMRNRMIMGALRYGIITDSGLPDYDHVRFAINALVAYKWGGNKEHLVDAANLCMIEFERPCCHIAPYFKATDDEDHVK